MYAVVPISRMKFNCVLLQRPCCAAAVREVACNMHLTVAQAVRYLQAGTGAPV